MKRSDQNQNGSDNNDDGLNASLNLSEEDGSQSPRYTKYRTSLTSSVNSSRQHLVAHSVQGHGIVTATATQGLLSNNRKGNCRNPGVDDGQRQELQSSGSEV
jgi:hypothetical protein